jgi:hypothetical protein
MRRPPPIPELLKLWRPFSSLVRWHVLTDLSVLRQGIQIGWDFGLHSLTELARIGEFVEHSVYEPKSLRRAPDGFRFVLRNPPLRMGAFESVALLFDSKVVPPANVRIVIPGLSKIVLGNEVDKAHPIAFPVGVRSEIQARMADVPPGTHRVRLELRNLAIPPLVWFEFTDRIAE